MPSKKTEAVSLWVSKGAVAILLAFPQHPL